MAVLHQEEVTSHAVTRSAGSVRLELSPKQTHDKVWHAMLPRNKEWLSVATGMGLIPVLVGHGLMHFYQSDPAPSYIILSTRDSSGDLRYERKLLLRCLEVYSHSTRRFGDEVVLEEYNMTLNIKDAYIDTEIIRIDPRRLFSQQRMSSIALFWSDYDLQLIGSDAAVGRQEFPSAFGKMGTHMLFARVVFEGEQLKSSDRFRPTEFLNGVLT